MHSFNLKSMKPLSYLRERLAFPATVLLLLLLSTGLLLGGCTTTPPIPDEPPKLVKPTVAMQEAKPLPTLGDDFAALCERDLEACIRRLLSVAGRRAELYNGLGERHAALATWINTLQEESNDDNGQVEPRPD